MGKPWVLLGEREYVIYKMSCKNSDDCYVGYTNNFIARKSQHKYNLNNERRRHYNYQVYKMIRDNGGWDNWDIEVIEKINCDRKEASKRENYWYNQFRPTMNSCIPCNQNNKK